MLFHTSSMLTNLSTIRMITRSVLLLYDSLTRHLSLLEVANNGWKAGTSNSNDTAAGCSFSASGACFTDRKLAAIRAYHEWMPIRQVDAGDKLRIWRNFQIGKLLDLTMLDTSTQLFRLAVLSTVLILPQGHYDRDITDVILLFLNLYLPFLTMY